MDIELKEYLKTLPTEQLLEYFKNIQLKRQNILTMIRKYQDQNDDLKNIADFCANRLWGQSGLLVDAENNQD